MECITDANGWRSEGVGWQPLISHRHVPDLMCHRAMTEHVVNIFNFGKATRAERVNLKATSKQRAFYRQRIVAQLPRKYPYFGHNIQFPNPFKLPWGLIVANIFMGFSSS